MIKTMVVEDFDILREDIVETLNAFDEIEVVASFDTGSDAVNFARDNDVDVILMDIELENPKAGIISTNIITNDKPAIKVIFLTAYEDDDLIIEAMESGGVDYIVKDYQSEELIKRIKNAYEDRVALDHKINRTIMDEYTRLRYSERSLLFFINNVGKLTPTEFDIVKYIIEGKTNKEMAKIRSVEPVTIKCQVRSLLNKFGCSRKKEIVEIIKDLKLEYLFFMNEE